MLPCLRGIAVSTALCPCAQRLLGAVLQAAPAAHTRAEHKPDLAILKGDAAAAVLARLPETEPQPCCSHAKALVVKQGSRRIGRADVVGWGQYLRRHSERTELRVAVVLVGDHLRGAEMQQSITSRRRFRSHTCRRTQDTDGDCCGAGSVPREACDRVRRPVSLSGDAVSGTGMRQVSWWPLSVAVASGPVCGYWPA